MREARVRRLHVALLACVALASTFCHVAQKGGKVQTFNLKAVLEGKASVIEASGARAVVLGDLGCMLNIEGRLRRRGDAKTRVLHVAEILAGSAE